MEVTIKPIGAQEYGRWGYQVIRNSKSRVVYEFRVRRLGDNYLFEERFNRGARFVLAHVFEDRALANATLSRRAREIEAENWGEGRVALRVYQRD